MRRYAGYVQIALVDPSAFRRALRNQVNKRAHVRAVLQAAAARRGLPPLTASSGSGSHTDSLLAVMSGHFPVLELQRSPHALHVGVADVDLLPLLQWLKESFPEIAVDPFNRASCAKLLHLAVVKLELPLSSGCLPLQLTVEPYSEIVPGRWTSRNARNRVMRNCYGDHFSTPGLRRATEILQAPLLAHQRAQRPVDAVFTWVDHQDQDWQAMYRTYRPDGAVEKASSGAPAGDAASVTRFHNNDELRYALRAVRRNLPWINQIHIFTNCRPPHWLDLSHEGINWVDHRDVIPQKFLPTFNSHVIESYLHHLPGLAEQFIYLNDDVFVMRPLEPAAFFDASYRSAARLEGYGVVSGPVRTGDPDYLNAARNSQALLRREFGFAATELHNHVPFSLLRTVLMEIEKRFRDEMDRFRANRFRSAEDLNLVSFLYHHFALAEGHAFSASNSGLLVKCNEFVWREKLELAQRRELDFVCINEGGAEAPPAGWHDEVRRCLNRWFPNAAPWEYSSSRTHQ
ncbi:stealth conserved region 3 domain-containing protein [Paracoccus tibetensis]|uniref:Stealth protein CR3, conserved region 3 n=1 Tax=Paracoccus tibetensis TaxID=336292 RepID=A0A1G5JXP0_9RHOB|nr:stealth conserved region 3 domain-containing protein [Paracoccus tibetensis]SCY93135.1 Stealth protein CR3, conserved region 3 [Paracoccus tibetensis]